MIFLFFVLVVALAAAAVWWLQRQQIMGRKQSIDLSRELPPLTAAEVPDFLHPTPTNVVETQLPTAKAGPTAPPIANPAPANTENSPQLWQEQVKTFKDRKELDAALSLCQQQFPRAQAFQQAAIVLRLQMKQQLEQQADIAPLLAKLYRCAVLTDLFRTGTSLRPPDARLALKALATHEFDYQRIGHQHLRLLNKSDVHLLQQRWGVPASHCHAEAALGSVWDKLCGPLA